MKYSVLSLLTVLSVFYTSNAASENCDLNIMGLTAGVDTLYVNCDSFEIEEDAFTFTFDDEGFLSSCERAETVEAAWSIEYKIVDGMPVTASETFINWWDDNAINGGEPPITITPYTFNYDVNEDKTIAVLQCDDKGEQILIATISVDDLSRVTEILSDERESIKIHYDNDGNAYDQAGKPIIVALAILGIHQPSIASGLKSAKGEVKDGVWNFNIIRK